MPLPEITAGIVCSEINKQTDHLAADEVAVMDTGVKLADVHEAELDRYLQRLATNFTAQRSLTISHAGKGRRPFMA